MLESHPMSHFFFDAVCHTLWHPSGRHFDAWYWRWRDVTPRSRVDVPPDGLAAIGAVEALRLVLSSGGARRVPVGVIGPREATADQYDLAKTLGRRLAELGLPVICGGKNGVMEAVCKGVDQAGGLSIGLIPEEDWRSANDYVAVPLATGIGRARNVLIAHAASALIAVGGQYGTITEAAFGLHFDKPVIGLGGAPDLPDIQHADSVDHAVAALAEALLRDTELS